MVVPDPEQVRRGYMLRRSSFVRFLLGAGIAAFVASACGGSSPNATSTDVGQGSLTGAGATFPGPFYLKAFSDYSVKYPQVQVNYQAVGSGAGIQQFIKKTVDFVELAYVVQTGMKQAALKNANGKFVQASVKAATAAAGTNNSVSPTNFSITNAACDECYPIAGFSWVMLYTSYSDAAKGKAVVNLFKWLVTDGQSDSSDLQYAPLPSAVQQLALTNLKTIKAG